MSCKTVSDNGMYRDESGVIKGELLEDGGKENI